MDRRTFMIGATAAGLAAPHVATTSAKERIARGPDPEPVGAIDVSEAVKGYRVDSLRGHSINAYFVRGANEAFAVDGYWRISEAAEAMENFERVTGLSPAAISQILITHPHTDHYGGVTTVREAAEGAPAATTATIARVIKNDEHGFYANRREDIPDDIPEQIPVATPDLLATLDAPLAGHRVEVAVLSDNEAIETALIHLPNEGVVIPGDLVNGKTTPVLYQGGLECWVAQLKGLRALFPEATTIAPGHGAVGDFDEMVAEEIGYLETFKDLVAAELERNGGRVADEGVTRITNGIVDAFPDWRTSAGVPERERLIALNIGWLLRGWRISGGTEGGPQAFRPNGE